MSKRVLVVDDEMAIVDGLMLLLEAEESRGRTGAAIVVLEGPGAPHAQIAQGTLASGQLEELRLVEGCEQLTPTSRSSTPRG